MVLAQALAEERGIFLPPIAEALPLSAAQQIAALRLHLAREQQRCKDLQAELQLAVDECCNDYWLKGHGDRVERLYGITNRVSTAPDAMDTVRFAHAALTGKADAGAAIAQCSRLYGEVIGIAL